MVRESVSPRILVSWDRPSGPVGTTGKSGSGRLRGSGSGIVQSGGCVAGRERTPRGLRFKDTFHGCLRNSGGECGCWWPVSSPWRGGRSARRWFSCRRKSRRSVPVVLWWPDQGITGSGPRSPRRRKLGPGRLCGDNFRRVRFRASGGGFRRPECHGGLFPRGAPRQSRPGRNRFRVFRAWPALRGVRSIAAAMRRVGVPGPACLTPPIFLQQILTHEN